MGAGLDATCCGLSLKNSIVELRSVGWQRAGPQNVDQLKVRDLIAAAASERAKAAK